jgi:amidase
VNELVLECAGALIAKLAAGTLQPTDVTEAHIAQIERLNPTLNAILHFDAEEVRAQARRLEQAAGAGAPRGPLWGLPLTVKSSLSVAGKLSETGSLLHRGHASTQDAELVKRLRAAGAVLLGVTNCPEFLMAYETDNRLYGRTVNPWDPGRTPGGSSGGEAAAIAAGLSAAGIGGDAGGSVRQPAGFCGICALKPTPHRIPAGGHVPSNVGPFALLASLGPIARTMEDVGIMFRALSGHDPADPASVPVPYREVGEAKLREMPIGFFEDDGVVPVTPETRLAVRSAADALRREGFRVEPFRPQAIEPAIELWTKLFVQCGWALLEPVVRGREADLSPTFVDFQAIAKHHSPLTANELLDAWMQIDEVRRALLAEMRSHPVLLSPMCAVPAFRHGERSWNVDGERVGYLEAMRYMQWSNVLGGPAAVVPVGRSPEGLPIGVQLAGRPYEDELVIAVASVVDRAFGYRPPPIAIG